MTEQVDLNGFDLFEAIAEEAAKGDDRGAKSNFGKVSIRAHEFVHWKKTGAQDANGRDVRERIVMNNAAEWQKLNTNDRSMKIEFAIDIQEFNPELDWTYARNVQVGDGDWYEIVKPSLQDALDKKLTRKNYGTVLSELHGRYVEIHDVPQLKNSDYSTVHFARVFATREECLAAYQQRFGGSGGSDGSAPVSSNVPPGYTAESWEAMSADVATMLALPTMDAQKVAEAFGVDVKYVEAMGVPF